MADVESLELQIIGDSKNAQKSIDSLISTLDKLKKATAGGCGLDGLAKSMQNISYTSSMKLTSLAKALSSLSKVSNIKLSSSIANQISAIGNAISSQSGVDYNNVKLLAEGLKPLESIGKSNLGSVVSQIKKLPEAASALNGMDLTAFASKIRETAEAVKPLADEMQKVANGFSAFPAKIQKFLNEESKVPAKNKASALSFAKLAAKVSAAYITLDRFTTKIGTWIQKSASYNENVNLFSVAMGEYANEAMDYANTVSEAMGIDVSEWIRNQGLFMTLGTGFGIVGERAATMSEQLTQLGYDLSSYYNISVEEAMQKLKSGFAGELEPLRNLGYDLSQAKLQAVALSLGINKAVSSMTQAEKAELRYYAIMTQVTQVHGDMARTLQEPANQMRIFKAQVEMAARSLGNVFIPLLNELLPYGIAAVKVFRMLADAVASFFGYEFPEIEEHANVGNNIASGFEDANEEVAKMKRMLLGIDELNIVSDNSSGSDVYSGSGFDFDIPTYDFLGEAVNGRVDAIVEQFKEWLGITGEITSWADLFKTKLGNILVVVGLIGAGLLVWKIIESIANVADVIGKLKGTGGATTAPDTGGAGTGLSQTFAKLKNLAKDLAMGLVIILEVAAAAALIVGAIWLLGVELEQVGIAWEPVIANGETIAIAMGLGTAFLVAVGVATNLLGKAGTALMVDMALGIATLAILGVSTALFAAEIWAIGWGLNEIGIAWDPVIANGSTIAAAIGLGTALLIGVGVVAAALGAATVASAGLLPIAIGLGTALLVELAVAFVAFTESLIVVANQLRDELHPAMAGACAILPSLRDEMSMFTSFMGAFAIEVVKYSGATAIAGLAATITKIIDFFTIDPVTMMADEVDSQIGEFDYLINGLRLIIPKIKTATDLINNYNSAMGGFESASGANKGLLGSLGIVKSAINGIISGIESLANGVIRGINGMINALNKLSFTFPDWVPVLGGKKFGLDLKTISTISIPRFEAGGFPGAGLFIAQEAGPELVGTIGNKTAVVNNDQIVESVSRGVYQAVVQAMSQSGGNQVVEAKVNDKVLFEVVLNRTRQETMRKGFNPLVGGV